MSRANSGATLRRPRPCLLDDKVDERAGCNGLIGAWHPQQEHAGTEHAQAPIGQSGDHASLGNILADDIVRDETDAQAGEDLSLIHI